MKTMSQLINNSLTVNKEGPRIWVFFSSGRHHIYGLGVMNLDPVPVKLGSFVLIPRTAQKIEKKETLKTPLIQYLKVGLQRISGLF